MGLDNGIIVKNIQKEEIPSWVITYNGTNEIELAYWRKYWGIRGDILAELHSFDAGCDHDIKLKIEDLSAIRMVLRRYLKPDYYNEFADSIWEYDEAIDHMIQIYINLSWLLEYWRSHPEIEVRFYDSF